MRRISIQRVFTSLLIVVLVLFIMAGIYMMIDSVWTALNSYHDKQITEIDEQKEKDQRIAELQKQIQELQKDFAPKLVETCPYCGKEAHEIPCQEEMEFYENSKKYFTVFSAFAKGIENGKYKPQFDSLLFQVFDPEGYKKAVEEQKAKEQKTEEKKSKK